MHVSRLRSLCIEIYKIMKDLNPTFKKDLFEFKSSTNKTRSQGSLYDLLYHRPNKVTYGSNSLRAMVFARNVISHQLKEMLAISIVMPT